MVEYRKTNLTLPESVGAYFDTLEPGERGPYMRALREAQWTLESIAQSSRVTRERVRQIVAATTDDEAVRVHVDAGRVPTPPEKPQKPRPTYKEPDPETLARLLELQPLARKVRSNSPNYREEAEEYTRLVHETHETHGVTLYRLAKRLGVTHLALRARLVRYGYKVPEKGGTSRVYAPILSGNRPGAQDES